MSSDFNFLQRYNEMGLFAPKSTISVHKIFLYYTYKPNNQDFTLLHKKPASTLRYFYIFCLSL